MKALGRKQSDEGPDDRRLFDVDDFGDDKILRINCGSEKGITYKGRWWRSDTDYVSGENTVYDYETKYAANHILNTAREFQTGWVDG